MQKKERGGDVQTKITILKRQKLIKGVKLKDEKTREKLNNDKDIKRTVMRNFSKNRH